MTFPYRPSRESVSRRRTLKALGSLALLGTSVQTGAAAGTDSADGCYIEQGGKTYPVEPISGDEPVEELYDIRYPDRFTGDNGSTGDKGGPYFRSVGTKDLQRKSTTITFLYVGPKGLSLVVVHDKCGCGDGGSVTWKVAGVPMSAEWLVKDDYYIDTDGEQAASNYDNWYTDGTRHKIDWTWGGGKTDGGALGYLGPEDSLTIHPCFNEEAELFEKYYTGTIEKWQFLSGDRSNPDRIPLYLSESLTVTCEAESEHDYEDKDRHDEKDNYSDDHDGEYMEKDNYDDDHDGEYMEKDNYDDDHESDDKY